jgi:putative ABC transport system substrate-binding protein
MRRRLLAIATAVGMTLCAPAFVVAQTPKIPRVGIVFGGPADDPFMPLRRQALRDAGYVEGQTRQAEWRFSEGRNERLAAIAVELVRLDVDALVTYGGAASTAARAATTKIPIVAVADDLVAEGHVASLARSGSNVTGVSILGSELDLVDSEPAASHCAGLGRDFRFARPRQYLEVSTRWGRATRRS